MCGFIAHFPGRRHKIDRNRLTAANMEIRHRGPDDEGYFFSDWVGLGHRRLAIMDLSQAGAQPMRDRSGRFIIVYNGELYNFRSLRAELEAIGATFKSGCDTEVVIEAFAAWGADCLQKFVGMFAFVIVDLKERTAFVARDQLGIKPLYYCEGSHGLLIASEIKAFRNFVDFELNEAVLQEQFLFRYVGGGDTIFRNIKRLGSGAYGLVSASGSLQEFGYYDVTRSLSERRNRTPDPHKIENLLQEHIGQHTQSDVGYNVQLSGGLDSSYITAVLSKHFQTPPETFSVTVPSSQDEGPYQRYVSEAFGTRHHSFEFDGKDLADSYLRATWHMDIPIVHTSCAFLMLLCDQSYANSKVILTGEGADELFSGYSRYRLSLARRVAYRLQRLGVRPGMVPPIGKLATLRKLLSRDIGLGVQIGAPQEDIEAVLSPSIVTEANHEDVSAQFDDLLTKTIAIDQTAYLGSMLERQDKMSMAASVESRVPFCVHTMFDYVNSWRPALKLKNNEPKSVLKKLAEKYFPTEFIYRRKNGFVLPLKEWLCDDSGFGRYLDLLVDQKFRERGIYDARTVSNMVDEHRKGTSDHAKVLIRLINFEIWHRMFLDGSLMPPGATTMSTN